MLIISGLKHVIVATSPLHMILFFLYGALIAFYKLELI